MKQVELCDRSEKMAGNLLLSPMLKWVGGKRQLLSEIVPMIDKKCSTYVEPFIGGGAVLFNVQPEKAITNVFLILRMRGNKKKNRTLCYKKNYSEVFQKL